MLHGQYTGARINVIRNAAERGSGLSLEANAKFYIVKYAIYVNLDAANTMIFTANSAYYGGAIHVDDDTNSGTCASYTKIECFFQVLALHSGGRFYRTQSMNFSQNHANVSGSTLYGGLLDRCAVSPLILLKYFTRGTHLDLVVMALLTLRMCPHLKSHIPQTSQFHLIQSECAFASMPIKTMTAATSITLRLKRDKHPHSQLLLSIRLANQLVQPSKPPSTSLRVV